MEISRYPSDYRPDPGGHFRHKRDERDVPGAVIQKAIESGDVKPDEADDSRVKLTTTYLGYEWAVIVDPDKQHVITAFCESGEWHD